ncbi:MAG: M48 family metallopeptidase [Candidatus Berkiella sp.]
MSDTSFNTRFFDGKSLKPLDVTVEIQDKQLLIKVAMSDIIYQWHYDRLQVMEPPHDNRDIVLGYKDQLGARLIVKERQHYDQIIKKIPSKHVKLSSVNHPWHKLMVVAISCSVLLVILLFGIPIGAPFIAQIVPQKWDDKLGQYVIKAMSDTGQECVAQSGEKALKQMVKRLSKGSNVSFDVKVVKSTKDNINAFAVPGNHLIIFSGLLDFAQSPDEVAGVLAHEMGHAIEHHPTQGLIRTMGINIVVASSIGSSADYLTQLFHLKFSREDESRADDIAVMLLKKANVSTKGFSQFFERFAKENELLSEHEEVLEYISSHPGMKQRMQRIKSIGNQSTTTPSLTTKEWQDLKNICNKTKKLEF